MKWRLRGENSKFPELILDTWKLGNPVPTWISDICKVKFMDGEGNITLEKRDTNTGGYELLSADNSRVLIKVPEKSSLLCWDGNKITVLREIQFKLLYTSAEIEGKREPWII